MKRFIWLTAPLRLPYYNRYCVSTQPRPQAASSDMLMKVNCETEKLVDQKIWDVFVSHASEDKDSFVRPLVESLKRLGVDIWYDEDSMGPGDSLSRSIDKGLAGSRFGIVVISPNFLKKPWPERELRGLVARDIEESGVILPIWHRVTKQQVMKFSPPLSDMWALNTRDSNAIDISIKLLRTLRPDLYGANPRDKLIEMASGEASERLNKELKHNRLPGVVSDVRANVEDWLSATQELHEQIYDNYDHEEATEEIVELLRQIDDIKAELIRIDNLALDEERKIDERFDEAADKAML